MTVREVIEATDRRKPNLYSREEKLRWLEEAEGMAWGALEAFHAVSGSFGGISMEESTPGGFGRFPGWGY